MVVGGSAASGASDNLTQTYDVDVMKGLLEGGKAAADSPSGPVVIPAGAAPMLQGGSPRQVVVGHSGDAHPSQKSGVSLPIVILFAIVLVGLLVTVTVLLISSSGGGETDGTNTANPAVRADLLLRNLGDNINRAIVSLGESPRIEGTAVALSSGSAWMGVSLESAAVIVPHAELVSAIPRNNAPVFVLLDQTMDGAQLAQVVMDLRQAGLITWIVGGSPSSTDAFYAFSTNGVDAPSLTIRLGATSMTLQTGTLPPVPICFTTHLPTEQIRQAADHALALGGSVIRIELAPGSTAQNTLGVAEAIYRQGLHLQLAVGDAASVPVECTN